MILGVDTGGTFTDFVLIDPSTENQVTLTTHKVLSTPDSPERAILQGINELNLNAAVKNGEVKIIHGSTVATNAALENKGVTTAFIANKGFKDILTVGRQTRPSLYNLEIPPVRPPVPEELCLEIDCRTDANGNVLKSLDLHDLELICSEINKLSPSAIAINLLFSYLNSDQEQALEEYLYSHLNNSPFICRSSFVLPEYREYERGIATWLNATLGPLVETYLLRLKQATNPASISVMQSTGGTISAEQAAKRAVNLLLSGPAGGLSAACHLANTLDLPKLITFDMGGTSTDVALIQDGKVELGTDSKIGPYPVAVPMVDMHTIGAGGGSIAYLDDGGLLQVGPRSAGANPGPACYNLGGKLATVSDANLLLGRLMADNPLAGSLPLIAEKSAAAIQDIAKKLALTNLEAADGIIRVANEHMARALRVVSVEKGHDPREFTLCCFGGAGGLHICALADALQMNNALVPMHSGVLSALGMLLAPVERQASLTHSCLLSSVDPEESTKIIETLTRQVKDELAEEVNNKENISIEVSADLRYEGQSDALMLPWQWDIDQLASNFHQQHESRFGHALDADIELVNYRISASWRGDPVDLESIASAQKNELPEPLIHKQIHGIEMPIPVYERQSLKAGQHISGAALITEKSATTFLAPEWTAIVHKQGHLLLTKNP